MRKASSNSEKITREEADLTRLLSSLPDNPFPWATAITLIAPIVARLAVRLALKRIARGMSEGKVNVISGSIADKISEVLAQRGVSR
ncbi:hypothetical protein ES705_49456 [subsurface metagenome]